MRIGRLALVAVAVPLAAKAMRRAGQSMQARKGNSAMGRAMNKAASGMQAYSGRGHSFASR